MRRDALPLGSSIRHIKLNQRQPPRSTKYLMPSVLVEALPKATCVSIDAGPPSFGALCFGALCFGAPCIRAI